MDYLGDKTDVTALVQYAQSLEKRITKIERVRNEWCEEYVLMRDHNAKLIALLTEAHRYMFDGEVREKVRQLLEQAS